MLSQWRSHLSRWGLMRTSYAVIMTGLEHCGFHLCQIDTRPLEAEPSLAIPIPEAFELRILSRQECLTHRSHMPMSVDFINSAFERGDLCAGALYKDKLVAFVWRSFSTAPHLSRVWVAFAAPHRYGYKAYTCPQFRGQRLHNLLSKFSDPACLERGVSKTVGFVKTHNFASINSVRRNSGQLLGYAGYIQIGRFFASFCSPGVKSSGFRFYLRKKN